MTKNLTLLCFFLALLSGCNDVHTSKELLSSTKPPLVASENEAWDLMLGRWFGNQESAEGGMHHFIAERMPDGTYEIVFRTYDSDGQYQETTEVGFWGISGPIYFSIFRGWLKGNQFFPSDSSDPYNYDAYEIKSLDSEVFEYEHITTGNHFTVRRVEQDFDFPSLSL